MKHKILVLAIVIAAALISVIFDRVFYLGLYSVNEESLNIIFRFLSQTWFLIIALFLVPSIIMYFKKDYKKYIVFHWASLAFSYIITLSFKNLFLRPRPFEAFNLLPFTEAPGYSFPSSHAATAFAALPILFLIFPKKKTLFSIIVGLIAFSRVYLGVHYLSDIIAGALIGLVIAEIILYFSRHYHGDLRVEINRQFFHLFLGILLVYLLYEEIIGLAALVIIFMLGIVLSYACTRYKVPFFSYMLNNFDREHHIPGYGTLTYFIGVIFCIIFFSRDIALASVLILAMGDSFSTLAGRLFGRLKNPFNRLKTVEGSIIGFIFAFLGAIIFVSPLAAIIGAAVGMLVEVFDVKYLKLDDNILMPLVAGIVMGLI
jgi:dolichol kinase/membrane-associated PAP2 superfamily phosphatase